MSEHVKLSEGSLEKQTTTLILGLHILQPTEYFKILLNLMEKEL